ncbi:MAG: universal stress protein [Brevundimonas sp.]|uniref:universal stress protein n=1 Tax=Brevundimonas sp. TaxID=1871086 RepID=UPI0039197A9C
MPYKDILLPLFTYPTPIPESAMGNAAAMAMRLGCGPGGGELAALVFRVQIPPTRNRLANFLAQTDDLIRDENRRCAAVAEKTVAAWSEIAAGRGLKNRTVIRDVDMFGEAEALSGAARTSDMCMVSIGPEQEIDRAAAESMLFSSGRPLLIFPEAAPLGDSATFERIVVAWDASRSAARALGDALPLLVAARDVRILTVVGEKASVRSGQGEEVVRHLALHGVQATVDEVDAAGRPIGQVLETYMNQQDADLLVMGGFGHSRVRDFLLGGATGALLKDPKFPVLLAH